MGNNTATLGTPYRFMSSYNMYALTAAYQVVAYRHCLSFVKTINIISNALNTLHNLNINVILTNISKYIKRLLAISFKCGIIRNDTLLRGIEAYEGDQYALNNKNQSSQNYHHWYKLVYSIARGDVM